jgi:hypothetical protein
VNRFGRNLSTLLRTADTRALELFVGLIAVVFSGQLAVTLVDLLPRSALVHAIPDSVAWLLVVLFLVGGSTKVVGAVGEISALRTFSAIALSGVWLYLSYLSLLLFAPFSLLLFLIFALQSAWIYIRLSLRRKQADVS